LGKETVERSGVGPRGSGAGLKTGEEAIAIIGQGNNADARRRRLHGVGVRNGDAHRHLPIGVTPGECCRHEADGSRASHESKTDVRKDTGLRQETV
jgi:hypothetical protein